MTHTDNPRVPLYDLFDGLGRRRRCRQTGSDPDQVIDTHTNKPESEVPEHTQQFRDHANVTWAR